MIESILILGPFIEDLIWINEYLTANPHDRYNFKNIKFLWKDTKKDTALLSIDFIEEGFITESYIALQAYRHGSEMLSLKLDTIFLAYDNEKFDWKKRLNVLTPQITYVDYVELILEYQTIDTVDSGDFENLKLKGIELRFTEELSAVDSLFPSKKGCEGFLAAIQQKFEKLF